MRITRRELAGLLAAAPAAARRLAAPTSAAAGSPAAPSQSAADDLRKNAATVRQLSVPADTEPAFSFRAQ